MAKELEYKLAVENEQVLLQILADEEIAVSAGEWTQTPMKTPYFDTPERRMSAQHITLRQRFEGEKSIVCVKTPLAQSHLRGEWQIEAQAPDETAGVQLVALGAPKELLYFYACEQIIPVCGAEFLRRHVMLTFPDGSQAELAGDFGFLHGQSERLYFTELELELYRGEKTQMLLLVKRLCEKYALHEEPQSKYARARVLK